MVTLTDTKIRPLVIIVLTVVIIVILVISRPDTQAELQPIPPVYVYTEQVRRQDIQPVSKITGQLQAIRKADLRFEVSGNVTARNIEPGQRVMTGQLLMKLDEADYADAVTRASSLLEQEQDAIARDRELLNITAEQVELLQREVERIQKLGRESLASRSNLDESQGTLLQRKQDLTRLQYSVTSAEARISQRQADLNTARRNLDRTSLTAPFDAVVNSVFVDQGDYVSLNQVAVELVQIDNLDLYLEVTGDIARYLELGQQIMVNNGKNEISGTLIALASEPDPVTHTYGLRIRLTANGFKPGQLATAILPGKELPDSLVVPISAVLQENGHSYLYIVKNNHLVRKEVSLIDRQEDIQVIEGVDDGDVVVIRDVGVLANGQEVQTRPK